MATNRPQAIIWHCSASKDHTDAKDWDAIRRYHVDVRGWSDIGYHYGIESVNGRYEVFRGRDETTPGAHCKEQGMNYRSIGVCLVGGDPWEGFGAKYPLPDDQLEAAVKLTAELLIKYGLSSDDVFFHRDFASYKTCPGVGMSRDIVRDAVKEEMLRLREPIPVELNEREKRLIEARDVLCQTAETIGVLAEKLEELI